MSTTDRANGVAKIMKQYDAWGNMTEVAYFDERGQPTRANNRVAKIMKQYDARGNMTEVAYFDEQGQLTRDFKGFEPNEDGGNGGDGDL
jgi:YD repeat-containing protein